MCVKCRADSDHVVEPILKYVLVLFNFLAFLISIGYIIGGAYLLYQRDNIQNNGGNFQSVFNILTDLGGYLIAAGIVGIIFTIIAIAATIRENVFLLRLYMVLMIIILILNLIVGVTFLIYSGKITTTVISKLQTKYVTKYFDDDEIRSVFDTLQSQYSCCGIQGYDDWQGNAYYNTNSTQSTLSGFVPASCCIGYSSTSANLFCSNKVLSNSAFVSNINTGGCRQAIINFAQYGVKVLSGVLLGVTIILAIVVILVQYLTVLIRKEQALYNAKDRDKYGEYHEFYDNDGMDYIN